jgi:hypothetical protein
MTDAEAVGNHVLLAQLTLRSEGPNSVAQSTKVPCVLGR